MPGPIEPIAVGEHITWFYWGRHPGHENLDMQLGGGAHAIHSEGEALLVDTMNLPGQAEWVRDHLTRVLGIERISVVNTHWHPDHVAGNHVFGDCEIIAHGATRELMQARRKELARGLWPGCPPLEVVVPTRTFEGRLDLRVGALDVELHEFSIHERGHLGVYLRDERTLIAGDMLEDPVWIFHFDFAGPERQLAEYQRMLTLPLDRVLATHVSPDLVKAGGYDARLIRHNAGYLRSMLADAAHPHFMERPAGFYLADAFAQGELDWWPPYEVVHAENRRTIRAGGWES